MLKRYTFWLTAAVLFMFVNAIMHAITLFLPIRPETGDESRMLELMTTLRLQMGFGFDPTFFDLYTAYSASYSMAFLLGGLMLGYLLIKDVQPRLMKGAIAINLAIYFVIFVIVLWFTFLPLVIFSALVVANLLAAYIFVPEIESLIVDDVI
jgi:hypothetical protein